MPFFPSCSIDGCLKLWEPEIRYSFCPKRNKRSLQNDMKSLLESKEIIKQKIEKLVCEDNDDTKEVVTWMTNVDQRNNEMEDLFSSLSTSSCWHLIANYHNARKVEELLRIVSQLSSEKSKWEDNQLVRIKAPQVSSTPVHQSPSMNQQPDPLSFFFSYIADGEAVVRRNREDIAKLAGPIVDTVVECFPSGNESMHLALRSIAGSLKNHYTDSPWSDAARKLQNIADSHKDQENITTGSQVIESILKFCYDSLGSDCLRHCLSSCALFNDSREVCELDLIASWMGEGLLDDSANIDVAYQQGHRVIGKLLSAHLLQSSDWCDFYLSMNVHVRYVASMAAGEWENRPTDPNGDLQIWSAAKVKRVSIREHTIRTLPGSAEAFAEETPLPDDTPVCPLLVVLLVGGNKTINRIHDNFFFFTPNLLVLDLSNTGIVRIPRSIGHLKKLRFLKLRELKKIRSLPLELGDLENLRQLDLDETEELQRIPRESISRLLKLQALFLSNTGHEWSSSASSNLTLEDLGGLRTIQKLSFTLKTVTLLRKTMELLASRTTGLNLKGEHFTSSHLKLAFSSLSSLEVVELSDCKRIGGSLAVRRGHLNRLRELKLSSIPIETITPEHENSEPITSFLPALRHLGIWGCKSLKNLTWLGYIEKLELVCLQNCDWITSLIDKEGPVDSSAGSVEGDDGGISFPKLQFLVLHNLRRLRSFSWKHPLRLPSLRTLRVRDCPNLTRLPFGHSSCKDIREIRGTREWWNALEWDQLNIKMHFTPYFKPF